MTSDQGDHNVKCFAKTSIVLNTTWRYYRLQLQREPTNLFSGYDIRLDGLSGIIDCHSLNTSSDNRLKHNETEIKNGLEVCKKYDH